MIVHYIPHADGKPTPEQLEKLRALKNFPIVYDEDCPELTPEQYEAFQQAVYDSNRRLAAEGREPPRENAQ